MNSWLSTPKWRDPTATFQGSRIARPRSKSDPSAPSFHNPPLLKTTTKTTTTTKSVSLKILNDPERSCQVAKTFKFDWRIILMTFHLYSTRNLHFKNSKKSWKILKNPEKSWRITLKVGGSHGHGRIEILILTNGVVNQTAGCWLPFSKKKNQIWIQLNLTTIQSKSITSRG